MHKLILIWSEKPCFKLHCGSLLFLSLPSTDSYRGMRFEFYFDFWFFLFNFFSKFLLWWWASWQFRELLFAIFRLGNLSSLVGFNRCSLRFFSNFKRATWSFTVELYELSLVFPTTTTSAYSTSTTLIASLFNDFRLPFRLHFLLNRGWLRKSTKSRKVHVWIDIDSTWFLCCCLCSRAELKFYARLQLGGWLCQTLLWWFTSLFH